MRNLKQVLHSRALGSRVFGTIEILHRSDMTDQLMQMRVRGRLDLLDLRAFIPEHSSMQTLRSLMSEDCSFSVYRHNDHEVLAWFAEQIATRRLYLVVKPRETSKLVVPTDYRPSHAPPAPQFTPPMPQSRRAPPPSPPHPPPQTFGHVDQDQQAAVLEAAARDGHPFCEECNKRAS